MAGSGNAIVDDIIGQWSAAFTRLDAKALSALYSEQALFYGSVPTLYRGRAGVASYFDALPRYASPHAMFSDITTTTVGADIVNMAGQVTFDVGPERPPLQVKITWIVVNETDGWHIISHHVSPIAPLLRSDS